MAMRQNAPGLVEAVPNNPDWLLRKPQQQSWLARVPVWKLVLVAFSAVAIVTVVAVLIKQFTQPGHLDASTAAPGTGQQQLGYAVLPPPGSQEAQKLLASNDTPAWVVQLYQYNDDAVSINANCAAAFLSLLQQKTSSSSPSKAASSRPWPAVDFDPFIQVSASLLSYLRHSGSNVLLVLLRQFCASADFRLTDVDPAVLQQEMHSLTVESLNYMFVNRINFEMDAGRNPWQDVQESQPGQGRRLHGGSLAGEPARMLLQASTSGAATEQRQPVSSHPLGQLPEQSQQATPGQDAAVAGPAVGQEKAATATSAQGGGRAADAAGTTVLQEKHDSTPELQPGATLQSKRRDAHDPVATSTSRSSLVAAQLQPQTLKDMICAAQKFHSGSLAAMLGGAACPALAPIVTPQFRPVRIPVVFHCLRWGRRVQSGVHVFQELSLTGAKPSKLLLPPVEWPSSQKAAPHLINAVNRLYAGTNISFVIQQVRTDPDAYPYLLTPSQGGFQECVANAANSSHPLTAVAVNCLTKLASDPLVQSLVADHVINVFVSITKNDTDYCTDPITRKPWPDRDAPPLCRVGLRLFDAAYGPWYTGVSKGTWDESDASKNFLFIHWELFDGAGLNRDDEHNAGGAALAHALGFYLGLVLTHKGTPPCAYGNTTGDYVADTPPNKKLTAYAAHRVAQLAAWCQAFRMEPPPRSLTETELKAFSSCGAVDNVLNVMSAVPHACKMVFSPGQVARLQQMVAQYRPKMMAKYALD